MKCAVLVSGGVDSSVALQLMRDAGYQVTAFYIKIWLEEELSFLGECPWQEDLTYVKALCQQLEVPLEVVSLQREYWERVVHYTIQEVKKGKTPNPDILCNQQIKFGAFFDSIDDSFDKVATGHYAALHHTSENVSLVQAPDPIKDQTYFLAYLNQKQLARAAFPLGCYDKKTVRSLAQQFNLPTKERKDSQGICFLGTIKFDQFLEYHLGKKEGSLIEYETGKIVGTHNGFWFFTLGQRKGIGLSGGPWYVVAKNMDENSVYISRHYHSNEKERNQFKIAACNWIGKVPASGQRINVKLRHGAHINQGIIEPLENDTFLITLDQRDQGIAPGQFAVFYEGIVCLGAGIIQESL